MPSLFVSALTGAMVALLVGYVAQPHLEARKDRVVTRNRCRRKLIYQVSHIRGLMWDIGSAREVPSQYFIAFIIQTQCDELRSSIDEVSPMIWRWQDFQLREFATQFSELLVFLHSVAESDSEKLGANVDKIDRMFYRLTPPGGRRLRSTSPFPILVLSEPLLR
jgi:hypothetical protein